MSDHVHGCLTCRPDMVPDFSKDDPRFHISEKCRTERGFGQIHRVMLDGVPLVLTAGHFEGAEGWALEIAEGINAAHYCPCDSKNTCVKPNFGVVASEHVEAMV